MYVYERLGIGEFMGALIDFIGSRTGIMCYDSPDGKESPFFSVEVLRTDPQNTKTMYIDMYEVWVHCISEAAKPYSSAPVLRLVKSLEEAMSEDLRLPKPFNMFRQEFNGLQSLKKDESGEGHAVLSFKFFICYGLRCK